MTDRELNERLASALDWACYGDPECTVPICPVTLLPFSPATSVDDLRKWVLPEVEARGLWTEFEQRMYVTQFGDHYPRGAERPTLRWFATAPPSILAAAALAVLEDDNAA